MFGSNQSSSGSAFGLGGGTNTNQQQRTGTGSFGSGGFGTPNPTTTAFGASSAFGQPQPANTGGFGSGTSAVGQPQQSNTAISTFGSSGGFGSTSTPSGGFGSSGTTAGGSLGAKPATTGFGSSSIGNGTGNTGAFGNSGGFGSNANTPSQGGFGSSALTPGQRTASPVPVTGSENHPYSVHSEKEGVQTYNSNFHAISMTPAYRNVSFEELRFADYSQGRRYGTGGAFGSTSTFGGATTGSTTGFGALGSPASNPGTAGAFGKPVQPATSGAFGLGTFGTPNTNATGGLGNATTTPATTLAGFGSGSQQTGGFGTSTSTQQNKPTFGSLGTTASNTTSPATVSTFISFSQKPTGTTLGGGFGSGTGGFGSTNSASTKGLGSFGNTTSSLATTGAALGISLGTGNTNVGGFGSAGSSFNKPATSTFSLGGGGLGNNIGSTGSGFGSSEKGSFGIRLKIGLKVPSQNNAGNGLLSSQPQQNTNHLQQNITASPYGSNPLFDTGGASSYSGNASKPVVPMATLMPREGKDEKNPAILAGFRLTPSAGKSRFSLGGSSSPFGGSPFNHRKRDVLGLGTPTKVILNPNPSSGSGIELTPEAFVVPKRGLKGLETHRGKRELTIGGDGEVSGFETGSAAGSSGGTLKSSVIDPHLERESREMDRQAVEQKSYKRVDSEESRPQLASSKPASTSKSNGLDDHASLSQRLSSTPPYPAACTHKTLHVLALEEGQYWTMPAMSTILAMPDVGAVPNFVVGRKGYGQVRFNQPVDLSQVRSIPDVPGTVVILDLKVCTVYPDESIKPRLGQGLNVPAIITLEKCWPVSKQTRRPILDVENPRFIAHVERLKRQPATEFVDYIANTGSWIFKVQHF